METVIAWLLEHAAHSPWLVFGTLLLAGVNFPISVDVVILGAAVLAATLVPEYTAHLYVAVFFGCYFSGWIAYWLGRKGGETLLRFRWFRACFPEQRRQRLQFFYQKYGFWTLIIGRWIPFGVRNCIFMSSGMSRVSFARFALWDFVACALWSLGLFALFFTLGKNLHELLHHVKWVNGIIFGLFIAVIVGWVWRKRKKLVNTPP